MNVCPKCNSANVEYFVAGYCPSCAGKAIGELETKNRQLTFVLRTIAKTEGATVENLQAVAVQALNPNWREK